MKKPILTLILLAITSLIFAEIRLPEILASNMVLQRESNVQLWGWANQRETIRVQCSWLDEPLVVNADNAGHWQLEVMTTNSKSAQSIRLTSEASDIQLDNVLFGEVWLCSGQSNMFQPLNGYPGQPTFGTLETLKTADNSNLRLFFVEKNASKSALDTLIAHQTWQEATAENILTYSAVAYYFGRQLQEVLDVPVGLIHTSWGGSNVQAWMSEACISSYQAVDMAGANIKKNPHHQASLLFNAMINPLIPFTIKGALWYQGESNRMDPERYRQYFPAMVYDWRQRWGNGEFPFYYVQIAPFQYGGDDVQVYNDVKNSAFIREVQQACLALIPNSGMAVTMDIGEQYSIHPAKKKEVADRLLYQALNKTYGYASFKADGPQFDKIENKGAALLVHFKNAEMGLYAFSGLEGFEIAGDDRVFYPAEARITSRRYVQVNSDLVPHPVAVRYAWRNWTIGTLYDTYLLPASSFRSDNWDDATRVEQ